jgi:ketosteroid isomerase-like protein
MDKEAIMRGLKRVLFVAVLVLLILSGSAFPQEHQDKLVRELQELQGKIDRAMVDGTVDGIVAFYADDAVVLPNNAPKIVGKAALKKMMEENRKTGVSFGSFTGTVERAWECGGMVCGVGSYAMSVNVPGMPRPVGDNGKWFSVFRRSADGKLLIVYDMWNTDIEYGK